MNPLRVLTLNIWNKQGPWTRRVPLIRRGIERLAPDIVGLQEVLRFQGEGTPPEQAADQAHEIADGLGYYVAYAAAWQIGGGLDFGNAFLSRYPIVNALTFPLPIDHGEEARSLLFVEVEAPFGRVPLFNTHLSWKPNHGALREKQLAFIAEKMREVVPTSPTDFPPILMGDLNAEPDSDEIRFLRGLHSRGGQSVYLCDSFGAVGEGAGHTFSRANIYAEQNREPNRRIDYIFVRGLDRQMRGEPLSSRVVFTENEGGVFASDHFGVLSEFQTAPRTRE